MTDRPNPSKIPDYAKKGIQQRHYNCDHYSKCLTKIINCRWKNFTCGQCILFKKYVKKCLSEDKKVNI